MISVGIQAADHETEKECNEDSNSLSGYVSSTLCEASPHEKDIALEVLTDEGEDRGSSLRLMDLSERVEGGVKRDGVRHWILCLELNELVSEIENSLMRILGQVRRPRDD
jgi:hypothetical protein